MIKKDGGIIIDLPPYEKGDHVNIREHMKGMNTCSYDIGVILHLAGTSDKDIIQCMKCKSKEVFLQVPLT